MPDTHALEEVAKKLGNVGTMWLEHTLLGGDVVLALCVSQEEELMRLRTAAQKAINSYHSDEVEKDTMAAMDELQEAISELEKTR